MRPGPSVEPSAELQELLGPAVGGRPPPGGSPLREPAEPAWAALCSSARPRADAVCGRDSGRAAQPCDT